MIATLFRLARKRYRRIPRDDFWQRYSRYLKSDAWKRYRLKVLERDRYTCQQCGWHSPSGYRLQIHHLNYKRLGHERLSDCITLCTDCHQAQHPRRNAR